MVIEGSLIVWGERTVSAGPPTATCGYRHHVSADPRPPEHPVDLTVGDPLSALHHWIAEGQIDEAARARARQHWLERVAAEDATLLGVLVDLGERSGPVTVTTAASRRITGPVVAVGADFVVLRDQRVGDVFVPVDRLSVVRSGPGGGLPVGDRSVALTLTIGTAMLELAAERPDVIIATNGEDVRGELLTVGADVVTLALDGARRDRVHVRLAAIDHVAVLSR